MFDLRIDGDIARLSFNRPEARNAIPLTGWDELASVLSEAASSGARALIVSGEASGAFCAGADLGDFHRFRDDPDSRSQFRTAMRRALDRLSDLALPSAALIEGACYGAGVALAIACDVRFAGSGARFAITPAKLGISYPQEDVHRLVGLVGAGQAARLLIGAGDIDGVEAARIGLVEVYQSEGIVAAAEEWARATTRNDRDSLRILNRGIALAAAGKRQDDAQDRSFDDLLGADALGERLARLRNRARE